MSVNFEGTPASSTPVNSEFFDFIQDTSKIGTTGYYASFDTNGTNHIHSYDRNGDGLPDYIEESNDSPATITWNNGAFTVVGIYGDGSVRATGTMAYDTEGNAIGLYVMDDGDNINPIIQLTPDTTAGDALIATFSIPANSENGAQSWSLFDSDLNGVVDRMTRVQTYTDENNVPQTDTNDYSLTWVDATHWTARWGLKLIFGTTYDGNGRPTSVLMSKTYANITWHTSIIDNVVASASHTKSNGNVAVLTFIDSNTSDTHLFDKVVFQENTGVGYADVDGWNTDGEHLISTKAVVQSSTWSEDIFSGTITGTGSNPTSIDMTSYFMANQDVPSDTTAPVIQNAVVNGQLLTMTFNENLGTVPQSSAFTVRVNGSQVNVSGISVYNGTMTLTLVTAVQAGQTVTVSYTDPTTGNDVSALQDYTGNDAESFTGYGVTNNTGSGSNVPWVNNVFSENESTPDNHDSAVLRVTESIVTYVEMSNAVTVTGTPRLALLTGSTTHTVYATYDASSSTSTRLAFHYDLQNGDLGQLAVSAFDFTNGSSITGTSGSVQTAINRDLKPDKWVYGASVANGTSGNDVVAISIPAASTVEAIRTALSGISDGGGNRDVLELNFVASSDNAKMSGTVSADRIDGTIDGYSVAIVKESNNINFYIADQFVKTLSSSVNGGFERLVINLLNAQGSVLESSGDIRLSSGFFSGLLGGSHYYGSDFSDLITVQNDASSWHYIETDTGNDTVIGSSGNDTCNISGDGNKSISLGDGNDVINWWSAGNSTIDGGAGIDELYVSLEISSGALSWSLEDDGEVHVYSGSEEIATIQKAGTSYLFTASSNHGEQIGDMVAKVSNVEYCTFLDADERTGQLKLAEVFAGGGSADTTSPTVTTFSPADGATGVSVGSDIVLTFSEAIQKGSGTIAIHSGSDTGAVVESFDAATSNRLSFTGSTVTINPTLNLSNNTQYFVTVMSGAVKDLAGNSFAVTSSYDFKTVMGSTVFNTTGSVNGTPQTGERYYSFSAGTGFVAQVLGNNFRFDLSSDTDNNPATFNASWNWLDILGAVGETGTGILTLQDTNTSSPGPENWSASLDFIRNIPLIADGSDADTLPDGFVGLDGMSNVGNVPLVWQAKDANNVIASFTSTGKNNQNNVETTSASLVDDNGDNVPDRIVGTYVSVDGSGLFNELLSMIDTNSDGKLDTMQLFMHRTFGGRVQVDSSGNPAGLYVTSGSSGVVLGSYDAANSLVIQSDGKILVAGVMQVGESFDFALKRYNSDGSLDTSFGGDGVVTSELGDHDIAMSVARQVDGKILVGGYIFYGDLRMPQSPKDWAYALVRYNSDGTLDTSFDGDGKVTANFDPHSEDFGNSVVIQSDGKILFSGRRYDSITGWAVNLLRYTSDGTLDTSFDTDGVVVAPIKGHRGGASVALQADGKILVTGFTGLDGAEADHDVALARYNTNGSLDASFGGTGVVSTNLGGNDDGYTVLVQSDGKIVVAGTSSTSGNGDFVLVRYNADGSLDTSFSGDGIVVTNFGGNDKAYSAALQADGKILLAGESDGDFAVARYNVDGTLDASFDGDGMTTMDLGGSDVARSVAVGSDGKIVVAGETGSGSNYDFALVRY